MDFGGGGGYYASFGGGGILPLATTGAAETGLDAAAGAF